MERIIKQKVDDIYEGSMEIGSYPGEAALSILKAGMGNAQEKRAAMIVRTREIISKDRKNNPLDFKGKLI
jgi:hypothetical protein